MNDHSTGWIVVGVNGSGSSAAAVRWAVKEARLRESILHLVFSAEQDQYPAAGEPGRCALQAAAQEASTIMPPGHLSAELAWGSPAQVLIDRSVGAELLVLGTACQPSQSVSEGPPFFGPVAKVCLRKAACPVVIIVPYRLG